jgi:hypothetical protein
MLLTAGSGNPCFFYLKPQQEVRSGNNGGRIILTRITIFDLLNQKHIKRTSRHSPACQGDLITFYRIMVILTSTLSNLSVR